MLTEDLRPEDLYGPDEQQATIDHLEGCGFTILDRNWQGPAGQLDIVAADRSVLVVFDVRRRPAQLYRPLHYITHVRQRQLRLLAAAWLQGHGKRFDQIRIDAIALIWCRSNGYTIEHVRGVSSS